MASLCRTFTRSPTLATASPGATLKRLPPDSETFPASKIGRIFRYVGSADVELPEGDHLGLILELSSVLGSNPCPRSESSLRRCKSGDGINISFDLALKMVENLYIWMISLIYTDDLTYKQYEDIIEFIDNQINCLRLFALCSILYLH